MTFFTYSEVHPKNSTEANDLIAAIYLIETTPFESDIFREMIYFSLAPSELHGVIQSIRSYI